MTTNTDTMLTVGERLKIARERAGTTVAQIADALGRHRNMVTGYETGDDTPLWVIRTYAETLQNETTVAWLTAESGPAPRRLKDSTGNSGWIYVWQPSLFADASDPPDQLEAA